MADPTAADVLVETLIDWGVDTIFGIPGDGINGIIESLRTRQDQIRFVQVRHEEAAAFTACAYAKWTGRLGVCLATSGPGRHPPAQRPLRRQARRTAGARHHRPAVPRPAAHLHPAGRRTRQAVHGRRASTTPASWARSHVENVVELACRTALGLSRRGARHHPGRHAVAAGRSPTSAPSATCPTTSRT